MPTDVMLDYEFRIRLRRFRNGHHGSSLPLQLWSVIWHLAIRREKRYQARISTVRMHRKHDRYYVKFQGQSKVPDW
jgi:hypothetical protein